MGKKMRRGESSPKSTLARIVYRNIFFFVKKTLSKGG